MPKGSGRGGNNAGPNRPGRPSDIPSPAEILQRRLAVHREYLSDGNRHEDADRSVRYHEKMAETILAQLKELSERSDGQMLEAMEGHGQITAEFARQKSLAEMNLCERTINGLEDYGILYAGELCGWTAQRILSCRNLGRKALTEIETALAEIGLRLRDPKAGETHLPPQRVAAEGLWREPERITPARRAEMDCQRMVLIVLAGGGTEADAQYAAGKGPGWKTMPAAIKAKIRYQLSKGTDPEDIAALFGVGRKHSLFRAVTKYIQGFTERRKAKNQKGSC